MKQTQWLLLPLLFFSLTFSAAAQPELARPPRGLKKVTEGRTIALTNTALATGTGILAATVFKKDNWKKAGAYLALYGLMIGPSTGNFYAEDYQRGGFGALARAVAGIWLLKDATREVLGKDIDAATGWDDGPVSFSDTEIWAGTALMVGSAIYNFISVKQSVREHNARLGYRFALAPDPLNGEPVPVFTARIRF